MYPELRSLIAKTFGLADVLRTALAPLGDRIQVAFVYGSGARDALTSASDVDVLVIGPVTFKEVTAALRGTDETLGREVNPSVFDTAEWAERRGAGGFADRVMEAAKIFLIGDDDDLGRLGGERLARATAGQRTGSGRSARGRRSGSG